MSVSFNIIQTAFFRNRPKNQLITANDMQKYVVNDFERIIDEINTIIGSDVTGTGTTLFLPKWTDGAGGEIGDSIIYNHTNGIRLGSTLAYPSALFAADSTTQGLLTPRMTTVQRDLIATPDTGLFIYNTTTSLFNYYDGASWQTIDSSTTADTLAQVLTAGRDVDATGTIQTSGSIVAMNINSRSLVYTDGTSAVLNWALGTGYSPVLLTGTFDWFNAQLNNGSGVAADWNAKDLPVNWTTITPTLALHIATKGYVDSVATPTAFINGGNSFGGDATLGTNDAFDLLFETSGAEKMRITSTGNVGIGTSSPTRKLQITSTYSVLGFGTESTDTAAFDISMTNAAYDGFIIHNQDNLLCAYMSNEGGLLLSGTYPTQSVGDPEGVLTLGGYGGHLYDIYFRGDSPNVYFAGANQATFENAGSGGRFAFKGANSIADIWGKEGNDFRIGTDANGTNAKGLYIKAFNGNSFTWETKIKTLNSSSGSPNLILCEDGGNVGVNQIAPSASVHVVGWGTTTGYSLIVQNSTPTDLFKVRDDGYISAGLVNGSMTIGYGSGFDALVTQNTFIGTGIATALTTGTGCTAIGTSALGALTSGASCVAVGVQALTSMTSGIQNTAIGRESMSSLTTGYENTALGYQSMKNSVGAYENTAIGQYSLYNNTSGGENSALGRSSLNGNTTGIGNVGIGRQAGLTNTTGNYNVFLGYQAGYYETGSSKLFIDNASRASEADGRVKALVYGGFASTTASQWFSLNSNVGIGTSTFGTNSDFVFSILNGTAPTDDIENQFQMYSADITAGNAAPHFRTENGNIVKLYQETTGVASATFASIGGGTNMKTDDTFDGYTLPQVIKALRNTGLLQ